MTRIYLAAKYPRIEEINVYAKQLRAIGYIIDAKWLLGNHQLHEGVEEVESAIDTIPIKGKLFAEDDFNDLVNSDIVICFTEQSGSTENNGHGGRHVEFGLALMWNYKSTSSITSKEIIIVGPRENVFYCLPGINRQFDYWSDCYTYLKNRLINIGA